MLLIDVQCMRICGKGPLKNNDFIEIVCDLEWKCWVGKKSSKPREKHGDQQRRSV
jgi:hypothetical protein